MCVDAGDEPNTSSVLARLQHASTEALPAERMLLPPLPPPLLLTPVVPQWPRLALTTAAADERRSLPCGEVRREPPMRSNKGLPVREATGEVAHDER